LRPLAIYAAAVDMRILASIIVLGLAFVILVRGWKKGGKDCSHVDAGLGFKIVPAKDGPENGLGEAKSL
jgi:hypothetical protein